MSVDLSVNYSGLRLNNPIIVGAGEITWSANLMKKAADAGAGAITVKTQHLTSPLDNRSFKERRCHLYKVVNAGNTYDPKLAGKMAYFTLIAGGPGGSFKSEEIVPQVKKIKKVVDIPIITSITGLSLDEYEKMARMNAEAGADAIEVLDPQYHARHANALEYTFADVIRVVKKTTNLPVSAKVVYAWADPKETVKMWEEAGADMIVAVGLPSLTGLWIDVETGKALFDNQYLGCYGSWFKPFSLSWVARAAQVSKIPISGVSGITKWDHAVEYLMAGATTVEVCSIIYVKGFRAINEIVNGLREFMERKGYEKIDDFRGITLSKFLSREEMQKEFVLKLACVNEDRCNGCGICEKVCINEAPSVRAGKAFIDPEKCEGCELCQQLCPAKAIYLRPN